MKSKIRLSRAQKQITFDFIEAKYLKYEKITV